MGTSGRVREPSDSVTRDWLKRYGRSLEHQGIVGCLVNRFVHELFTASRLILVASVWNIIVQDVIKKMPALWNSLMFRAKQVSLVVGQDFLYRTVQCRKKGFAVANRSKYSSLCS
jgi:hypothetical protein